MLAVLIVAVSSATLGQVPQVNHVDTYATNLNYPARISSSNGGGLYVTDPPMNQVVEYDDLGQFVAMYDIPETPIGVATHTDGRVFVSHADGTVGVYDAGFVLLGLVNPTPFTMSGPNDLAFHPTDGDLYVVDSAGHQILVFEEVALNVWALARMWGTQGSGLGEFQSPQSVAIDTNLDHVIVTDVDNFRVQVFDTAGTLLFKFGYRTLFTATTQVAWFARSEGLAIDSLGNIFIADALMGTVRAFDATGKEIDPAHMPLINFGTGPGNLRIPCDLMFDVTTDSLFVASTNNATIEVYDVTYAAPAPISTTNTKDIIKLSRKRDHIVVVPDNPFEIVAAIEAGEHPVKFDLNRDRVVDEIDLQLAAEHFDGATAEDMIKGFHSDMLNVNVFIDPPHFVDIDYACGRCHSMDGLPGGMLSAEGQANLCQSCHTPGGVATNMPMADPELKFTHPIGVPADQGISTGPIPGSPSEMEYHLDNGDIRCGTCHQPHNSNAGSPNLRADQSRGALCAECHKEVGEWLHAGHADESADPWSHYDWSQPNRSACRKCHSGNGFIDASKGIAAADQRGDFRVLECTVCHAAHGAAEDEHLLRIYGDVTVPTIGPDETLTGKGAMATCMACHNGRRAPDDGSLTPHYMLGGVMLEGINGEDFGNTSLTSSAHTGNLTCMSCHMADTPADGMPGAGKVGGHSFNLTVHDATDPDYGFENVANACQSCHAGLTTLNRMARGDYDGGGTVEGVQDEVRGLMDLVFAEILAKGAVFLGHYPYWDFSSVAPADDAVVRGAIWNWEYVDNSGDFGIKNTSYAVGLLQLTYEELAGTVLADAYLRYVPAGAAPALQYTGTDSCMTCHGAAAVTGKDYSSFLRSGHPFKLNKIIDAMMPLYPFTDLVGALGMLFDDDSDPLDPKLGTDNTLGTPLLYDAVTYVIGGFGWKARFIDAAGYIVTGSEVQYNLETMGMSAYHDNETDKPYNCGNCHTTGWKAFTSDPGDTRNLHHQDNLPGMAGTFAAPGVHCESCHGAGSFHVAAPSETNIVREASARTTADFLAPDMAYGKAVTCSECHTRDGEMDYPTYVASGNRIKTSGGLIRHHEQYDEMVGINPDDVAGGMTGPHAPMQCQACHDSHTTTKHMAISGDAPGMNKQCTDCHNTSGLGAKDYNITSGGMAGQACTTCHMPQLVKNAVSHTAVGTGPVTGDIKTHIFGIDLSAAAQITPDGAFAYPWITGEFACKTCHNDVDEFDLGFPSTFFSIHGGVATGVSAKRGGLLYDKWWKVNGAAAPTGDHPLYPATSAKSGDTTFRCKECHGWDYIGVAGRYESGSHFTGIIGVLGAAVSMSDAEIFDIIKNPDGDGTGGTTINGHDFGTIGLSDADIDDLVAFVKTGVVDTSPFINTTGVPGAFSYSFIGDAMAGEALYDGSTKAAASCKMCHGYKGTAIDFGGSTFVGTVANSNPQETFHKIRFGHPGTRMTSYFGIGMSDLQAADVAVYTETLP